MEIGGEGKFGNKSVWEDGVDIVTTGQGSDVGWVGSAIPGDIEDPVSHNWLGRIVGFDGGFV